MRQFLALTACCVAAGGLLWDRGTVPEGPCWKEAGTAFPFSGPGPFSGAVVPHSFCPEEVFTKSKRIDFI